MDNYDVLEKGEYFAVEEKHEVGGWRIMMRGNLKDCRTVFNIWKKKRPCRILHINYEIINPRRCGKYKASSDKG